MWRIPPTPTMKKSISKWILEFAELPQKPLTKFVSFHPQNICKFYNATNKRFLKFGPLSLVKTIQVPTFQVKGTFYLLTYFDWAYYLCGISRRFALDETNGSFQIVESLTQQLICTLLIISETIFMGAINYSKLHLVSSNKDDLLHCFGFFRDVCDTAAFIVALHFVIGKKSDFRKLLGTLWPKMRKDEFSWGKKRLQTSLATLTLHLIFLYYFLTEEPAPLKVGMYEAGQQTFDRFEKVVSREFPLLSVLFPSEGSWTRSVWGYVALLIMLHFWLTYWHQVLSSMMFSMFIRSYIKSFNLFLEKLVSRNGNVDGVKLFEEYLEVKRIVASVNQYISPLFTALVLGAIPYWSFFLANFSEIAKASRTLLCLQGLWNILILSAFFAAASSNAQAGGIKNILVENKPKLETMFKEPSEYSAMLMDLGKGNELGMTCFGGSVTMDYSLIGTLISSSLTFTIILIQAQ